MIEMVRASAPAGRSEVLGESAVRMLATRMIDIETARRIVSEHLAKAERAINDFGSALPDHAKKGKLHLTVCAVEEYDFGWVFFWTAREYVETRDFRYALAGNAPLIVDRNDEGLYVTGTAKPVQYYIEQYRKGFRTPA